MKTQTIDIAYANKFLEYGDIDYEAAKVLFDIQDRNYDFMNQAAFFCAQATEKYLKAFLFGNAPQLYPELTSKQILNHFKRQLQHNLIEILNECILKNKDFNNFKEQIKKINTYSLLKYPDIEDEIIYSDDGLIINSELTGDVRKIGDFIKTLLLRSNVILNNTAATP